MFSSFQLQVKDYLEKRNEQQQNENEGEEEDEEKFTLFAAIQKIDSAIVGLAEQIANNLPDKPEEVNERNTWRYYIQNEFEDDLIRVGRLLGFDVPTKEVMQNMARQAWREDIQQQNEEEVEEEVQLQPQLQPQPDNEFQAIRNIELLRLSPEFQEKLQVQRDRINMEPPQQNERMENEIQPPPPRRFQERLQSYLETRNIEPLRQNRQNEDLTLQEVGNEETNPVQVEEAGNLNRSLVLYQSRNLPLLPPEITFTPISVLSIPQDRGFQLQWNVGDAVRFSSTPYYAQQTLRLPERFIEQISRDIVNVNPVIEQLSDDEEEGRLVPIDLEPISNVEELSDEEESNEQPLMEIQIPEIIQDNPVNQFQEDYLDDIESQDNSTIGIQESSIAQRIQNLNRDDDMYSLQTRGNVFQQLIQNVRDLRGGNNNEPEIINEYNDEENDYTEWNFNTRMLDTRFRSNTDQLQYMESAIIHEPRVEDVFSTRIIYENTRPRNNSEFSNQLLQMEAGTNQPVHIREPNALNSNIPIPMFGSVHLNPVASISRAINYFRAPATLETPVPLEEIVILDEPIARRNTEIQVIDLNTPMQRTQPKYSVLKKRKRPGQRVFSKNKLSRDNPEGDIESPAPPPPPSRNDLFEPLLAYRGRPVSGANLNAILARVNAPRFNFQLPRNSDPVPAPRNPVPIIRRRPANALVIRQPDPNFRWNVAENNIQLTELGQQRMAQLARRNMKRKREGFLKRPREDEETPQPNKALKPTNLALDF